MASVSPISSQGMAGYNTEKIEWMHLIENDQWGYPIDYWIAVLGSNAAEGRVDFLGKWEPDCYCHFHRHLGETTTLVLEGEHHVVETSDTEIVHKTRKPGHISQNPAGDLHMEYAGPSGSVVFFSMKTPDGRLFDILDREENLLVTVSLEDFVNGTLAKA